MERSQEQRGQMIEAQEESSAKPMEEEDAERMGQGDKLQHAVDEVAEKDEEQGRQQQRQ